MVSIILNTEFVFFLMLHSSLLGRGVDIGMQLRWLTLMANTRYWIGSMVTDIDIGKAPLLNAPIYSWKKLERTCVVWNTFQNIMEQR